MVNAKPHCRWCGKAIAKRTVGRWFSAPLPHSREEAQRRVNGKITKINRWPDTIADKDKAGRIYAVKTWDGESYATRFSFFCSNACAGRYAENRAALTGEGSTKWQAATAKAKGRP